MLAVATHDEAAGEITVFAVDRSLAEPVELSVDLRFGTGAKLSEHLCLAADDPFATNTRADPDRVVPRPGTSVLTDSTLTVSLPPISWHCLRITQNPPDRREPE